MSPLRAGLSLGDELFGRCFLPLRATRFLALSLCKPVCYRVAQTPDDYVDTSQVLVDTPGEGETGAFCIKWCDCAHVYKSAEERQRLPSLLF